jgi:hypothetical protein
VGRLSPSSALLQVLLLAAILRVVYALGAWILTRDPFVFHRPDSESYLGPARELWSRGTFTLGGDPELKRTPGYPLLLVPGLWLGHPTITVVAFQVVLSTLTWRVYTPSRFALLATPARRSRLRFSTRSNRYLN